MARRMRAVKVAQQNANKHQSGTVVKLLLMGGGTLVGFVR